MTDEQNKLVEENMRLVGAVISRTKAFRQIARWKPFRGAGIYYDDLEQAGLEGLIKAAISFDPTRGRFSTWAWNCISLAIWSIVRAERAIQFPLETGLGGKEAARYERVYEWQIWAERDDCYALRWTKLPGDPPETPEDLRSRFAAIKARACPTKLAAAIAALPGNRRKLVRWVFLNGKGLAQPAMAHRGGPDIAEAARAYGISYFRAFRALYRGLGALDHANVNSSRPQSAFKPPYSARTENNFAIIEV